MTQPTSKRLLTEASAGEHAANPATPLGAALSATYAPVTGSAEYATPAAVAAKLDSATAATTYAAKAVETSKLDVSAAATTYVAKAAAEAVTLNVGTGSAYARVPFRTKLQANAAAAGSLDWVGHLLSTDVVGDFTGVSATNPGWVWGANLFTNTGAGTDDAKGVTYLTGALVEASIGGTDFTGTAFGLMAEAAFIGSSAGGTVGNMTSLKVGAPKRKDGAVAGTATSVYGVWVDAVADGALGSAAGVAHSLYVEGGKTYLGGNVLVGGDFVVEQTKSAYIGNHKIYNKSGRLGLDVGIDVANILVSGNAAITGTVSGASYSRQSDSSRKILWGTGAPEGVHTASGGSIYLRTDGGALTTMYVKETGTGSTGWVAK